MGKLVPNLFTRKSSRSLYIFSLLFPILIYSTLFFVHSDEPLYGDECWTPKIINSYLIGRIPSPGVDKLYHPPLNSIILSFLSEIGNGNIQILRLLGFLSHLLTAFLLFYITRYLVRENSFRPYLAFILYLTHPLSIQSSLLLDIDTGLLIPAILILSATLIIDKPPNILKISLATFIAFLTKLTTPIPVVFAAILATIKDSSPALEKRIFSILIGIGFATIFIFITAEFLGCSWTDPFVYLFSAFQSKSSKEIANIIITFIRSVTWFSPYLILIFFCVFIRCFGKGKDARISRVAIVAFVIFFGYLIIGGVLHGYPKYQLPALPLIIMLISLKLCIPEELLSIKPWLWIFIITFLVIIFSLIMPDPLLLLNYEFRNFLLTGKGSMEIIDHAGRVITALAIAPLIVLIILKRSNPKMHLKKIIIPIFLVCTLGYNLAIDLKQATATYATRYCYGERGTFELASLVRTLPAGHHAVVPEHIQFLAGITADKLIRAGFWRDINEISPTIAKPQTMLFAYSLSYNTVKQLNGFKNNERMKKILNDQFFYRRIGTFDVWQRKDTK